MGKHSRFRKIKNFWEFFSFTLPGSYIEGESLKGPGIFYGPQIKTLFKMFDWKLGLTVVLSVLVALIAYDMFVRKALKISQYEEYEENFDDYAEAA